jgi:hypothetical protein
MSKLKFTVEIDTSADGWRDEFRTFMKMLIDNGYGDQVSGLAQQMVDEARRRNLPIVKELGL